MKGDVRPKIITLRQQSNANLVCLIELLQCNRVVLASVSFVPRVELGSLLQERSKAHPHSQRLSTLP
jgi:hypothetical protein